MNRLLMASVVVLSASACEPPICGSVILKGVAPNPEIAKLQKPDGTTHFAELCGTSYGAFSSSRMDTGITSFVLSANVPGAELSEDLAAGDIVLPAGSVVFWNEHVAKGSTVSFSQMAGSALNKSSEGAIYTTYPLTGGSITFVDGPFNHHSDGIENDLWTEEWQVTWALDFGGGVQHWDGSDLITRSRGTMVGSEAFTPPDPKP